MKKKIYESFFIDFVHIDIPVQESQYFVQMKPDRDIEIVYSFFSSKVLIVTFRVCWFLILFPRFIVFGAIFLFLEIHEFDITLVDLSNLYNISFYSIDVLNWSSIGHPDCYFIK